MAYTNLFATVISEAVGMELAKASNTFNFVKSVPKYIVPAGEKTVSVPIPGTMTGATRTAGSAYSAGTMPTDSSVSLAPITEYYCTLPMDRIYADTSQVNIVNMYAPVVASTIMEQISDALWALYSSVVTNVVGSDSEAADMSLLAQARRKLLDAKAPMAGLKCCIGGAESQAWLPQGTYDQYGPIGQPMLEGGVIGRKYGFDIMEDQDRATSGGVGYCLAYHPMAFAVSYKNTATPRPGTVYGNAMSPIGVTVHTEFSPMNEATNGVGTAMTSWIIADVDVIYEKYACIVKGITG